MCGFGFGCEFLNLCWCYVFGCCVLCFAFVVILDFVGVCCVVWFCVCVVWLVFRVFCWLCDLLYFFLVDLVNTRLWGCFVCGFGV